MSEIIDRELDHLTPAAARLGWAAARPRLVAIACVIALTGLGWLYLGVTAARQSDIFAVICEIGAFNAGWSQILLALAMWSAMVLAMMLPSAAPMILTYAEIAETAARKNETVVSPLLLAAGYCVVWLGFALAATAAQVVLARAGLLEAASSSLNRLFAGALFVGAGAYQFSALKQACLRQCRDPFPFFFTNWATTARGVLRLGIKQGLYCLGCCWAAMLLMFVFGAMNVLWMAMLAIVMTGEKLASGARLSYAIGVIFFGIGIGFIVTAFAAQWPLHV